MLYWGAGSSVLKIVMLFANLVMIIVKPFKGRLRSTRKEVDTERPMWFSTMLLTVNESIIDIYVLY